MFATNVILSLFLSQLFIFIIKHCSVGLSRLRCFHEIGFRIWSSLCFIILALPGHVYYKLYSPQWGIFCLLLFIFNPSPKSSTDVRERRWRVWENLFCPGDHQLICLWFNLWYSSPGSSTTTFIAKLSQFLRPSARNSSK